MTRSVRLPSLILATTVMLGSTSLSPAWAAMNAEDAKNLKTIFGQLVEKMDTEARLQGGQLETEGEIMVEASDNYFAITLPHMTFVGADQSKVNIGMIAINAMPGSSQQEWKMTVAIPTPITLYGSDGRETGVIEIGSQNFAGVYNQTFGNFVRLNGRYKDISITEPLDSSTVKMGEIAVVYDLKESASGIWSGPMNMAINNISALFNKTGSAGKIGSIKIDSTVKNYSVAEANAYSEKMNALLESLETDAPSVSAPHVQGMFNTISDFLTTVWDGFGSEFTVSGIEFMNPPKSGQPASTFKMDHLSFGMTADGMKGNKASLQQTLKMAGLSVTPSDSSTEEIMPENLNLDMTVTNLPLQDLIKMAKDNLNQGVTASSGGNLAALNAMAQAQQLLTQSATTLTIKDTGLGKTGVYDLKLNGAALANIQAVMGGTGKVRLEIAGIENMIALAQKAANDPALDAMKKDKAAKAVQSLTFMQMIGQQTKNAAGQDIRAYDFELTGDGKTLLNGADMMSVMGGMPQ